MKLKTKNKISFVIKEICLYLLPITWILWIFFVSKTFIQCISIDQMSNPNSISCDWLSLIIWLPYWIISIVVSIILIISLHYYSKTKKQINSDFISCIEKIKKENSQNIATTFKSKKLKSK